MVYDLIGRFSAFGIATNFRAGEVGECRKFENSGHVKNKEGTGDFTAGEKSRKID